MGSAVTQRKMGIKLELKEAGPGVPEGSFKAFFSTFGRVDHDGDVTFPDAFEKGAKVSLAGMGHNWDIPTIGFGIIDYDSEKAWIDGQFNLKMAQGKEHYESVKFAQENGVDQEWSYSYGVKKEASPDELKSWPGAKRGLKQLAVKEVSPVMLGAAGTGYTGTLAVKGRKMLWPTEPGGTCPICGASISSHLPEVLTRHRDVYAAMGAGKGKKAAPLSDEDKRRVIQDAIDLENRLAEVAAGEEPGWAGPYITATYSDYVVVCEDDGYYKIPYTLDGDGQVTLGDPVEVEKVWAEKSDNAAQMKYADHADRVLAALKTYTDRSKSLVDMRAKVGRTLSTANRERIAANSAAARAAADELDALLAETDPGAATDEGKSRQVRLMKARVALGEMSLRYGNN